MLTGVRLSIGIAWLVIVAAEMLTGGLGIGFWIWNEWNNLNVENIIIAIVIIGVVGLLLDRRLMTWIFCNGGWQSAASPLTGRNSICWRWCRGASPCSRAQASARRSAASSWSFSPALRIATRK